MADAAPADTFLRAACPDWRTGGPRRAMQWHAAGRLLRRDPAIARHDLYTAVACGDRAEVARRLAADPALANTRGGPRDWPPLLYLCAARLPEPPAADDVLAIARLLLDHGADPNAYLLGGHESIHYTALALVLGRGEERATSHPQAPALARLLMERGAEPYDPQMLYNVFADHDARRLLSDDDVWLLETMHARSVQLGRAADWHDPAWRMLDMGGHGPGAYFLLNAAIDANLLGLAAWMLAHGASPDVPPPSHPHAIPRPLLLEAERRGHHAMANLLRRHGASPAASAPLPARDAAWRDACLRLDRDAMRDLLAAHPEHAQSPDALLEAARHDRADVVAALLDLGVSPDVEDPRTGARALHAAASHDATRVIELLVARGAAIDPREREWGATPIWCAVWGDRPRAAARLAPRSRDAWSLAAIGDVARLRDVLREDPSRARSATEHETPLMWLPDDASAAREIAALLLAHGADATVRDAQGRTAAELAEARGLDDAAALLRAAARAS
ncbi:MAG: ankyrin repeat domain-containing protein [Gemmatirosa sp.]